MRIIGLTGPTGSGKSTVAAVAAELGYSVIDCDKIARKTAEKGSPALEALCGEFGNILLADGSLDRKMLAEIAFADKKSTETLNRLFLPFIVANVKKRIKELEKSGVKNVLLDAPTLFESGLDASCDEIIAVLCSENVRRSRIIARDRLTDEEADSRLSASKPDSFYKARTDKLLNGESEMGVLISAARRLLSEKGE